MSLRKSNRVIHIPKCVICPRDNPSFVGGETFVAIPSQLNENGKWKGSFWHMFCGKCFQELIEQIQKEKILPIGEIPLEKVDFMNLLLNIPITIFKEKYKHRIEFKVY